MKGEILVSTSAFASFDQSPLLRLRQYGFHVKLNPVGRKLTKQELLSLLSGAVGLIAGVETIDYEVMSRSDLKVISRCGVGLSNIDLEAAKVLNIKVRSTPEAPTAAVAELTMACLLSLLRAIPRMNGDLHEGKWNKQTGFQLKGKTVLIVGFGRIGQQVAQLLMPFEVKIIVADPLSRKGYDHFEFMELEKALPLADIITLHASGEKRILDEKEFGLIKKGAFLLNAARGGLINEEALIRSLDEDRISGAWLDVFDQEPYSGRLIEYPQVILTPHVGSYTQECRKQMELEAVENLISAFEEIT